MEKTYSYQTKQNNTGKRSNISNIKKNIQLSNKTK